MDKMLALQKRILTDAETRKAFAASPVAFLTKEGIAIPPGVKLPASIPIEAFEAQIAEAGERLAKQGINLTDVTPDQLGKGLLTEAELEAVAGGAASDAQLIAVVAVVVVAVAAAAWTWVTL